MHGFAVFWETTEEVVQFASAAATNTKVGNARKD